jgi:hypothetical protein
MSPPPRPAPTATRAAIGAAASLTGTRHIHVEYPAHEVFPVEPGERGLHFRCRRHLDEAEPSRLPARLVLEEADRRHRPEGLERRPGIGFGHVLGQVAYVDVALST